MKHLEPSLFQSCEILYHYFKNSVAEEENERKENAARERLLWSKSVRKYNGKTIFWYHREELEKLLKPHIKRWDNFRELFAEKTSKTGAKIGLPVVLIVNGHYIHRDHCLSLFFDPN